MGGLDDKVDRNFFELVKHGFLEHFPKLVGLLSAAAIYKGMLELGFFYQEKNVFEMVPFFYSGPLIAGYFGYKGADYLDKLHTYKKRFNLKSVKPVLEKRQYTPKARGLRRTLDWILEHPREIGLFSAIPATVDLFNLAVRFEQSVSDFNSVGGSLSPYFQTRFALDFASNFFYIGFSYFIGNVADKLLSAFFHSENKELIVQTVSSHFYRLIGNKKKFEKKVRETAPKLQSPGTYQSLSAILAGEGAFEEAFSAYLKSLRLLREQGELPFRTLDSGLDIWFIGNHTMFLIDSVWKYEK